MYIIPIENRVRICRSDKPLWELQGSRSVKVSEYRYVPQRAESNV